MMQYRSICRQELDLALFAGFIRRQEVTRCWRKVDGAWVIRDVPFVDDWSETDYATLVNCLRRPLGRRAGWTKAVYFRPFRCGESGILQKNGLRGGRGI